MDRGAGVGQRVDECGAALAERLAGVVVIVEGEQIEGDKGGRYLPGKHAYPRRGRVQPQLQRLEV